MRSLLIVAFALQRLATGWYPGELGRAEPILLPDEPGIAGRGRGFLIHPTFDHRDALGELREPRRRIYLKEALVAPHALDEDGAREHSDAVSRYLH